MLYPFLNVVLLFWLSVEIVLASSSPVSLGPSPTVVSSYQSASLSDSIASPTRIPIFTTVPTPAYSSPSTVIVSSKSLFTSAPKSENVQPTVSQSPTITETASVKPTGKSSDSTVGVGATTTPTGVKGKTIGALEIIGFCLAGIVTLLVAAFAVYYFAFRRRWYPQYWDMGPESPPPAPAVAAAKVSAATTVAAGERKTVPEIGITHDGFVGDASSSTQKVPPVFFSTNAHVQAEKKEGIPGGAAHVQAEKKEGIPGGAAHVQAEKKEGIPGGAAHADNAASKQEEEEGEENAGFSEDSAL